MEGIDCSMNRSKSTDRVNGCSFKLDGSEQKHKGSQVGYKWSVLSSYLALDSAQSQQSSIVEDVENESKITSQNETNVFKPTTIFLENHGLGLNKGDDDDFKKKKKKNQNRGLGM